MIRDLQLFVILLYIQMWIEIGKGWNGVGGYSAELLWPHSNTYAQVLIGETPMMIKDRAIEASTPRKKPQEAERSQLSPQTSTDGGVTSLPADTTISNQRPVIATPFRRPGPHQPFYKWKNLRENVIGVHADPDCLMTNYMEDVRQVIKGSAIEAPSVISARIGKLEFSHRVDDFDGDHSDVDGLCAEKPEKIPSKNLQIYGSRQRFHKSRNNIPSIEVTDGQYFEEDTSLSYDTTSQVYNLLTVRLAAARELEEEIERRWIEINALSSNDEDDDYDVDQPFSEPPTAVMEAVCKISDALNRVTRIPGTRVCNKTKVDNNENTDDNLNTNNNNNNDRFCCDTSGDEHDSAPYEFLTYLNESHKCGDNVKALMDQLLAAAVYCTDDEVLLSVTHCLVEIFRISADVSVKKSALKFIKLLWQDYMSATLQTTVFKRLCEITRKLEFKSDIQTTAICYLIRLSQVGKGTQKLCFSKFFIQRPTFLSD